MTADLTQREVTLKEDPPGTWTIETKNDDGEGGVFKCTFAGPYAKSRATRHLDRVQRNVD